MNRRLLTAAVVLSTSASLLVGSSLADRPPAAVTLPGHVPAWAGAGARIGSADDASQLSIQVVLPWRDSAAARSLAYSVSDPADAAFGRHLTAAQWRERYAPSSTTVRTAQTWLGAAGLELGALPGNRVVVPARGSVAQVERLLATDIGVYAVEGLALRAPDRAPAVPAALAALGISIRGLDDGAALIRTSSDDAPPPPLPEEPATPADGPPPPAVAYAAPCSAYHAQRVDKRWPKHLGARQPAVTCHTTHTTLRAAYGVDRMLKAKIDGSGETVVMVGSHAIKPLRSDISTWSKRRGIPELKDGQLRQVSYPGAYQTPSDPTQGVLRPQVWAVQASTLLETIHAVAPAATLVYVGTTSSLDLPNGTLLAVDAEFGDVVMNGWYKASESNQGDTALISRIAEQAAGTGISLLFASGDLGDNTRAGGAESTVYPASEPMATAVGATSMIVGKGGRYVRELAWAKQQWVLEDGEWTEDVASTYRGSGGGISKVHAQPAYQKPVVPASLATRDDDTLGRAVPDVALLGDAETAMLIGYTQRFPDGKDRYHERRVASGTASTALFAGLLALANDRAGKNLGFVNPQLYSLARSKPAAFRDITRWGRVGGGIRIDHVNGSTPADGTRPLLKTFEEFGENVPRRGYDTATGIGAPSPSLLTLLR